GGRVLYPTKHFYDPLSDCHTRQPGPCHRQKEKTELRAGLRLRLRLLVAECAKPNGAARHWHDLRPGKEHHHLQPSTHEYAIAWVEGYRVPNLPRRHVAQRLGSA